VRRRPGPLLPCGREAWLDGFTVSEFYPAKLLTAAVVDQARKHRKRAPDEMARLTTERSRPRRLRSVSRFGQTRKQFGGEHGRRRPASRAATVSSPFEQLAAAGHLRVARVLDLYPGRRRPVSRIGPRPPFPDDAFQVSFTDGLEELPATSIDVIGVHETRLDAGHNRAEPALPFDSGRSRKSAPLRASKSNA